MSKLITFFMFMFIGATILSAVMEGGGGVVSTPLTASIDNDDTTLSVTSTSNFLDEDYVYIGDEKIYYTGTTTNSFTGCTRGYDGSNAVAHGAGSMVYTKGASTLNNALDFDVATTADSMGVWATITIPYYFLTKSLPNIIAMNFSFLTGDMAIIGLLFFAMGTGLIITIAISLAGGRRI